MDCPRHLNRWCCALLLAGAAVWPAVADDSVIFSKPADLPTDKANSFMGDQHKTPGSSGSSSSILSSKPRADFDILPGAQRTKPLSPEEIKRWEKNTDNQKNWTLLTPQEILGIPSPEKIMGLPDPNNRDGSLSATERYMNRQEAQRNMSATNALRQGDSLWGSDNNPFQSQKSKTDGRNGFAPGNLSDRTVRGSSPSQSGADQSQNTASLWHSAFAVAAPAPKADPEQVAAMERFRALMEPPPVEKPVSLPGYPAMPAPAPAPKIDPYMQPMPASYNAAGRSFTPVENTAGRPTGITPLPTITGQTPYNQTAPKPKPLVKPPPWMSKEPQPGEMPQRQF